MQEERLIQELLEKHEKLRDEVGSYFGDLRTDNIRQIRDLVKHFIIIASATIGFTLPVFGSSALIKNSTFLIGGLLELLIVVLYGFYYLKNVLESDNKGLSEQHKEYNTILDEWRNSITAFALSENSGSEKDYKQTTQKILNKLSGLNNEPLKKQHSHALDIIFSAFFIGLFLIILSITDVTWLFT